MGLFDKIFGNNEKENKMSNIDWKFLTEAAQIETIAKDITGKVSVLFKHSTRCGISMGVLSRFEAKYKELEEEVEFYYLDLLNHRDLSQLIAEKFEVTHQSPQLILVKNGVQIANDSHYEILNIDIEAEI